MKKQWTWICYCFFWTKVFLGYCCTFLYKILRSYEVTLKNRCWGCLSQDGPMHYEIVPNHPLSLFASPSQLMTLYCSLEISCSSCETSNNTLEMFKEAMRLSCCLPAVSHNWCNTLRFLHWCFRLRTSHFIKYKSIERVNNISAMQLFTGFSRKKSV